MSQCLAALYITAMVNHKQKQTYVKQIQEPGVVTAALIVCCTCQILTLLCYNNYIFFFLVEKWFIFLWYFLVTIVCMCVCMYGQTSESI